MVFVGVCGGENLSALVGNECYRGGRLLARCCVRNSLFLSICFCLYPFEGFSFSGHGR